MEQKTQGWINGLLNIERVVDEGALSYNEMVQNEDGQFISQKRNICTIVADSEEGGDFGLNNLLAFGSEKHEVHGILNYPGSLREKAPEGHWITSTEEAIKKDFSFLMEIFERENKGTSWPDKGVVPPSVLERFKRTSSLGVYLEESYGITFYGDPSTDGSLVLFNSKKVLAVVPQRNKWDEADKRFETRCGGVTSTNPKSILRLDGI